MKISLKQILERKNRTASGTTPLTYEDGFEHGFDAGQQSCAGDISVATLIKELIDRGDYKLASKLLDEIKDRD